MGKVQAKSDLMNFYLLSFVQSLKHWMKVTKILDRIKTVLYFSISNWLQSSQPAQELSKLVPTL